MTRTVVQHSDRFIRSGLVLVLEREPDLDVVGEVCSAPELIAMCAERRPDAVVIELDTQEWDVPRLAATLRKRQRTLQVVGIYESLTPASARLALQAGVRTIVAYAAGSDGITAALRGKVVRTPITSLPTATPAGVGTLTAREVEILSLIAAGRITREVGRELGVSLKTVENHKQRIFRKLQVQNQAHAVAIAIRRGLLPARRA